MSRSRYHHILNHLEFMANCDDKKKRNITRNVIINTLKNYQSAKGNALKVLETENAELRERVGVLEKERDYINKIATDCPELNMDNYDEYDVETLNNVMVDIYLLLNPSPVDVEKGEEHV